MFPKLDQGEFKLNFDDKINEYQLTVTNVFGQVVLSEFRKDKSSSVIIYSPAGVYMSLLKFRMVQRSVNE